MRIVTTIIAVFLTLSLTGCAYNHQNAILRDMSYGATIGALPGLALMSVTPTVEEDDVDIDTELGFFGISLAITGIGAIGGLAIGTVVGIFQWMYETATWQPPEQEIAPPAQPVIETYDEPTAVRQGEEPAAIETTGDDITEEPEQYNEADYAPQAVR